MANFDYHIFRIKNVSQKIHRELSFYEESEFVDMYPVDEYIEYLKSRMGLDKQNEATMMMQYDGMGNKREIKKMNMDEYYKDMDILVFTKPWNKLKPIHKTMKIKEYINSLEYNNKVTSKVINKNKNYLIKEICDGLSNKKFIKNKSEIIYDQETRNILSISCMNYNKKSNLYEIDWDE